MALNPYLGLFLILVSSLVIIHVIFFDKKRKELMN